MLLFRCIRVGTKKPPQSGSLTRTARDTFELRFGGRRYTRSPFKGKIAYKRCIVGMTAQVGRVTAQGDAAREPTKILEHS